MAGLKAIGYKFDYDDFHSFVHGRLPYETLKPDPVISHFLRSLPIRKVIFTNSDQVHAAKVLEKLGLEDCFDTVVCFETLNPPPSSSREDNSANIFDIIGYLSKSDPDLISQRHRYCVNHPLKPWSMLSGLQTLIPKELIRNIQSGKEIGLHTVLVGTSESVVDGADHALESLRNMREALPELWEEAEKSEDTKPSTKIAIETPVVA